MKGCLKHSPPPSSPATPTIDDLACKRKAKMVVFCPSHHLEEVHVADEWDRTPTEPARHLSYQDMLELKEIQRSLPRANQPRDPYARRQPAHYLSAVPIGLLPLLPDSDPPSRINSGASSPVPGPSPSDAHCASQPSLTDHTAPPPSSAEEVDYTSRGHKSDPELVVKPGMLFPFGIPGSHRNTPTSPLAPSPRLPSHLAAQSSHLAHLIPKRSPISASRSKFSFIPLLDTPPSSASSSVVSSAAPSPYTSPFPSVPSSPAVRPVLDELENERDYTDTSASASPETSPQPPLTNPPHLDLPKLDSDRPPEPDENEASNVDPLASDAPAASQPHADEPAAGTLSHDHSQHLEPPTPPLTNASLDSSPHSHLSSLSPERAAEHADSSTQVHGSYFPLQTRSHVPVLDDSKDITELDIDINLDEYYARTSIRYTESTSAPHPATARLAAIPSPALIPPSPLCLSETVATASHAHSSLLLSREERLAEVQSMLVHSQPLRRRVPLAMAFLPVGGATIPEHTVMSPRAAQKSAIPAVKAKPRRKKRTFILINDEEVEIPGDESETDSEAELEFVVPSLSPALSQQPLDEAPSIPVSKSPVMVSPSPVPSLPSPVSTPPSRLRQRELAPDSLPPPSPSILSQRADAQTQTPSSPEPAPSISIAMPAPSSPSLAHTSTSTPKSKASQQATPPPSEPGSPRLRAADFESPTPSMANTPSCSPQSANLMSRREKERRRRSGSVSSVGSVGSVGGAGGKLAPAVVVGKSPAMLRAPASSA
ncbi:hypothetical protein HGRIS_004110 [Hohenbuehelia grisea]|uniref:Uncharacterized protein n=1 Tax=Hohenbuehelia grisea TaxID=104357 RepID=A0ABR3JHZ9_9AGAR